MELWLLVLTIALLLVALYQARAHKIAIEQLEEINASLTNKASRDALTGLWNRGALVQRLKEVLPEVEERPVSLLMVDLDHFKKINDEYGHQVGDDVLEHTAAVLRRSVRRTDFAARYGGEEFVIIVMDAPGCYAESLADRIRKEIEENPDREHYTAKVTASIGVVDLRGVDDRSIRTVLEGVDAALYMAKESGRNRVYRGDRYLSSVPPAPKLSEL